MELYYLDCLRTWMHRMKRPPWSHEIAAWLGKSKTAVFSALVSLEHKGKVRRAGRDPAKKAERRFVPSDYVWVAKEGGSDDEGSWQLDQAAAQ